MTSGPGTSTSAPLEVDIRATEPDSFSSALDLASITPASG